MREFKVGDAVWEARHGHGIIQRIEHISKFPIRVLFLIGEKTESFTLCGRFNTDDLHRSLFHADEIPGQCEQTLTAEQAMTRRDEFAIRIACAFIPNDYKHFGFRDLPPLAVKLADALIAELDRTKKEAQS